MAKAINFGLMFGLGAKKFSHYAKKSYGVEVSEKEAYSAVEAFRETYTGYREWQLKQVDEASETKTVRTPFGKLRRLPSDNTYGTSMNTPIQGGAAECMLASLVELNKNLNGHARLVNCVHDEILVECDPDYEPEYIQHVKEKISKSMTDGFLKIFPNGITNNLVGIGVGDSWGAAK